jgi:hypothetical protein
METRAHKLVDEYEEYKNNTTGNECRQYCVHNVPMISTTTNLVPILTTVGYYYRSTAELHIGLIMYTAQQTG